MAQPAEFHLKLLIGDLALQLAIVRAELERAKEELAAQQSETSDRVRPFAAAGDSR